MHAKTGDGIIEPGTCLGGLIGGIVWSGRVLTSP